MLQTLGQKQERGFEVAVWPSAWVLSLYLPNRKDSLTVEVIASADAERDMRVSDYINQGLVTTMYVFGAMFVEGICCDMGSRYGIN